LIELTHTINSYHVEQNTSKTETRQGEGKRCTPFTPQRKNCRIGITKTADGGDGIAVAGMESSEIEEEGANGKCFCYFPLLPRFMLPSIPFHSMLTAFPLPLAVLRSLLVPIPAPSAPQRSEGRNTPRTNLPGMNRQSQSWREQPAVLHMEHSSRNNTHYRSRCCHPLQPSCSQ